MSNYAKKTCNICGVRDEQPYMHRVHRQVNTGSSNTGLAKRTMLGAVFGNEKSQKAVGKWALSPNKRNYKRTREVWMCGDCAGASEPSEGSVIFGLCIIVGVPLGILYWLTGISPFDIIGWFRG